MPIYEYRCNNCGKISEFLVGVVREELEIKCNHCGSKELNKVFSRTGLVKSGHLIASQGGKTCCGRTERCDVPPCSQ